MPSGMELWVIVIVVVLLFGTRKLPELGAGLGKAITNFRESYKDGKAIDVSPTAKDSDEQAARKTPEPK